jgi:hypothetical protein
MQLVFTTTFHQQLADATPFIRGRLQLVLSLLRLHCAGLLVLVDRF